MNIQFKHFFYPANLLSLGRIALIVPIAYLIKLNTLAGNAVLILLALITIATDYLDGYLSRKRNEVTDLGKVLDPLADKIAMAVGFIFLIAYRAFPAALVLCLLYRDFLIVVLGWFAVVKTDRITMANSLGKINTTIVSVTGLLFLVHIPDVLFRVLLLLSYISIAISGVSYAITGQQLLFSRKVYKVIYWLGLGLLTCAFILLLVHFELF